MATEVTSLLSSTDVRPSLQVEWEGVVSLRFASLCLALPCIAFLLLVFSGIWKGLDGWVGGLEDGCADVRMDVRMDGGGGVEEWMGGRMGGWRGGGVEE